MLHTCAAEGCLLILQQRSAPIFYGPATCSSHSATCLLTCSSHSRRLSCSAVSQLLATQQRQPSYSCATFAPPRGVYSSTTALSTALPRLPNVSYLQWCATHQRLVTVSRSLATHQVYSAYSSAQHGATQLPRLLATCSSHYSEVMIPHQIREQPAHHHVNAQDRQLLTVASVATLHAQYNQRHLPRTRNAAA